MDAALHRVSGFCCALLNPVPGLFRPGFGSIFGVFAGGLQILAQENTFAFRRALLTYRGALPGDWKAITWRGGRNRFDGPETWLAADGLPEGLNSVAEKHVVGQMRGTALAEPPAQPVQTVSREVAE